MTQLLENTLTGGVMIVVVLSLRALLRRQTTPGVWISLWAVCLFRLLTPVSLSSALSFYHLLPEKNALVPMPVTLLSELPAQAGSVIPAGDTITRKVWVAVYILIAAAIAVRVFWSWFSVGREIRCITSVESAVAQVPRGVQLRIGYVKGAPLTFGVVRPVIVLPPKLSNEDLRYVLAHEAVHARRRDNLWHYLMSAALILHWYNPLVWVMWPCLRTDVELSCDRAALRQLGTGQRAAYANTLICLSAQARELPFSRPFGAKRVRQRIVAIMKFRKMTALGVALALFLVCGVTAVFAAGPIHTAQTEHAVTSETPFHLTVQGTIPGEMEAGTQPNPRIVYSFCNNPSVFLTAEWVDTTVPDAEQEQQLLEQMQRNNLSQIIIFDTDGRVVVELNNNQPYVWRRE